MRLPLVSNIIPGLMSQADKVKLDGLFSSTSGLILNQFSASIIKAHQFTSSYLSASSGGINSFSATTLTVQDLVVINTNITGGGAVPDPLSSSIQRSHQLSSSYFSASSGGAGNFSATTLTVQDLIVINTNMTGGGAVPDPLSSSVQRSHNLSASYFEFISGNINRLTASSLSSTIDISTSKLTASFMTASTGTFFIVSASYGGYNKLTASSFSSTIDVQTSKLTASFATASTGTFFIASASYLSASGGGIINFSATTLTVQDLIVVNTNMTATDPFSASVIRAHNLSASYFEFISGNINRLTASSLSSTIDVQTSKLTASFLTASTGTFFIASSSYGSYNKLTASSFSSTIDIQTSKLTASFFTASTGTFFIVSASYAEYNKFTASSLSSTIDVQTSKLTASFATASTGTFFIISSSYSSASQGKFDSLSASSLSSTIDVETNKLTASFLTASTGTFFIVSASYAQFNKFTASSLSSTIDVATSKLTASFATASTGTFFIASASYLSSTYLTIQDLIVINSNITSTIPDPLSSSIQRSHNLSASYFEFISGNINRLTASSLSSTIDVATSKLTASFLTASTGTFFIISGSYAEYNKLTASSLSSTIDIQTSKFTASFLTASTGTFFIQSSSYASSSQGRFDNLTASSLSSTVDISTNKLTASFFTASTGTFFIISASYGNYNKFTASSLSSTIDVQTSKLTASFLTASTGTFFIQSSSYGSSTYFVVQDLVVINSNITGTASVPDPLSSSIQRSHELSASYFEFISGNINRLTASSFSSTVGVQTNKLTASFATASTGTFFIASASYASSTRLNSFELNSDIIISNASLSALGLGVETSNVNSNGAALFLKSDSGNDTLYLSGAEVFVQNGSVLSATTLWVQDLVVINTNMTGGGATDPFSASVVRAHNLSASYFEFISGNINRLTASSLSSTIDVQTSKLTASFATASTGTFFIASASYFSSSDVDANTLTASQAIITNLLTSWGTYIMAQNRNVLY